MKLHRTSLVIFLGTHFPASDGVTIRTKYLQCDYSRSLAFGVTVFHLFWKNKWKMPTHLDFPDASCVMGRPLEDRAHLLNTHRN